MADINRTLLFELNLDTGNIVADNGKVITSFKQLQQVIEGASEATKKMEGATRESSEVTLNSINHIKQQINYAKQQRNNTEIGSEAFIRYSNTIENLDNKLKLATSSTIKYTAAAQNASNVNKKMSGSAGLAGAATFELGRLISDLPFGLVAVSNNLSQLGILFGGLIGNAGGFREALRLMMIQITNPLSGALLAFQLLTAALAFFSQKANKAKEDLNKLTEEISKTTSNLKVLKSLLEEQALPFENLAVLIKQANDENKNLNLSLQESEDAYRDNISSIEDYIEALELAARAKAVQSAIESEFESILKEQQEQQEDQIKSYDFLGKAWGGLKGSIISFYEGISGSAVTSEKKIINSQMKVKELIMELEELFRQGFSGDPKKTQEGNDKILELQRQLVLAQIKIEEDRLKKQLSFIRKDLETAKEGSEAYLKLKIDEQKTLDSLQEIKDERAEDNLEKEKRMRELDKQLILEGIVDEQDRLRQRIAFIDAEMEKEEAHTENYKKLQLEKIKAVNALAAAEEKARQAAEKEDERVNKLRAKLFENRIKENSDQEKKWIKSQISSLETILENSTITDEERAESELELYDLKKRLAEINLADAESIANSISKSLDIVSSIVNANAERELSIEQNKTNALNDQLKQRLANEQLSADERDAINQEIARNEARLVEKENEINKKRFEQQKALQMAQAIVEVYRNAWLAFGSQLVIGDPSSAIRAKIAQGVALAAGLANLAIIARQKFVGKAMPTPNLSSQGVSSAATSPQFNVVGASQQTQIAEAIAAVETRPVKAYVVSSDVSTAQELDRRIVEGASI